MITVRADLIALPDAGMSRRRFLLLDCDTIERTVRERLQTAARTNPVYADLLDQFETAIEALGDDYERCGLLALAPQFVYIPR